LSAKEETTFAQFFGKVKEAHSLETVSGKGALCKLGLRGDLGTFSIGAKELRLEPAMGKPFPIDGRSCATGGEKIAVVKKVPSERLGESSENRRR